MLVFHNHHEEEHAVSCEESVGAHGTEICHHGAHVSAIAEKCLLCEHFSLTAHKPSVYSFAKKEIFQKKMHSFFCIPLQFESILPTSSRGPPIS